MLPAYALHRTDRQSRRVLEVLAEGLTHDAARALAHRLRADADADAAGDGVHGFAVVTLPLWRQAELAQAAGLMLAADPQPYALAA